MKKLTRIFAVLLLLSLIPVCARAETDALEQVIYESCLYDQEADLTEFEITYEEFNAVFERMLAEGRLPWYAEDGYSYSYNEASKLLLSFTPKSKDTEQYDYALYEQRLAEAMDACVLEGMTPLQIALSVHDYLILNNIYDETLEKNTGYDLLVHGTTVCAGYAELYTQILNKAGVPCITVTSEEMEHAWNLVQLGGNWYHVDLTWDDPTPDYFGHVEHTFFLLTDEEISAGEDPHHGWDSELPCTDTRYADGYWRGVESAIVFESSAVSYLIRNEDWDNRIYRRDESTGEETLLYSDTHHYVNTGDGSYAFVHRGLALEEGRVYFNIQDAICSMNTDGTDVQKEFIYDTEENKRFLYSFWLEGGVACITVADQDYNHDTITEEIPRITPHMHQYTDTVQPATCTEAGHTDSLCDCGITARHSIVAPTGHSMEITDKKAATFFGDGYETGVCSACETEVTTVLPQVSFIVWFAEYYPVMLILAGGITLLAMFLAIVIAPLALRRKKSKDLV